MKNLVASSLILLAIGLAPQIGAAAGLIPCELNLVTSGLAKGYAEGLSLSAANRLLMVMDAIPDNQRNDFLKSIDEKKLHQISMQIQGGTASKEVDATLTKNPGLKQFLVDLSQFTDTIPHVMSFPSPEMTVFGFLKSVIDQEKAPNTQNANLLESAIQGPRLRWAFFDSLEDIIYTATQEYKGLGRSGLQYAWFRIWRFFDPSYNEVRDTVLKTRPLVHQIERKKVIDAVAIEKLFSHGEKLNQAELTEGTGVILSAHEELKQLEGYGQQVFGPEFSINHAIEKGKSDIKQIFKNLQKIDWEKVTDSFDTMNVASLDKVNKTINDAHKRLGLAPITVKDYLNKELSVYLEAFEDRIGHWRDQYLGWTGETSKESYTITDRYWVEAVKDKDGKEITAGYWRYDTTNVTPSFEEILDRDFRTGNYSDGDLPAVKARTQRVADRESGPRSVVAEAGQYFYNVHSGYEAALATGKNREEFAKGMAGWMSKLDAEIKTQADYAAWSEGQIHQQYSKDVVENFQARNQWLLKRMQNLRRAFETLNEMLRRGQVELYLTYPDQDFTLWMEPLRHIRDVNYEIKSGIGIVAIGATSAYIGFDNSPEFHDQVNQWAPRIGSIFQSITDTLHGKTTPL